MVETMRRPWSEVGIDVSDQESVEEALEDANLNFEVKVLNTHYKLAGKSYSGEPYNFIVRTDGPRVLGTCKGKFVPLQNHVLAEIAQPWINDGSAKLDTIGTFGNGEKVWILLKLPRLRVWIRDSDAIDHYLLLLNGHDGSTSIQMGIIPFRLWCANQLPRLGGTMEKFRHTENASDMLAFFRDAITSRLQLMEQNSADLIKLTQIRCSFEEGERYFRKVLGMKAVGDLTTRSVNILEKVLLLFGRGGTWWDAFNAVNEYLNYEIGREQVTRLNSLWFGANNTTNEKALKLAMEKVL